jgi:hypothetical protein
MLPADKADEIQPPGAAPAPAAPDEEDDARVVAALLATLRVEMEQKQEALLRAVAEGQEAIAEVIRASIAADLAEKAALEVRQTDALPPGTTDAPPPAPATIEGMAELVAEVRAGTAALVERMTAMEARQVDEWTKLREGAAKSAERMGGRLRDLHVDAAQREQLRRAHAEMLPGLRLTAQDAMRRILHREGGHLRRAAQSPEKLRAWAETFYVRRQPMVDTVLPVLTILAGLKPGEPPSIRAERLVAEHCERSRRDIGELLETHPKDLAAAVETLAARWEADRPAAVAHALIQEVMGHE